VLEEGVVPARTSYATKVLLGTDEVHCFIKFIFIECAESGCQQSYISFVFLSGSLFVLLSCNVHSLNLAHTFPMKYNDWMMIYLKISQVNFTVGVD